MPSFSTETYIILLFSIGYNVTYKDDKKYGKSVYRVTRDVKKIATEIMTNGPVGADFTAYADFTSYKSGRCDRKVAFRHALN